MKTEDILMIGGGGLLLLMLLKKKTAVAPVSPYPVTYNPQPVSNTGGSSIIPTIITAGTGLLQNPVTQNWLHNIFNPSPVIPVDNGPSDITQHQNYNGGDVYTDPGIYYNPIAQVQQPAAPPAVTDYGDWDGLYQMFENGNYPGAEISGRARHMAKLGLY